MVKVKDVSIWRGKKQIVDKVNLHLAPGEIQVLMGANGAGKSTLLNTLAGGNTHYTGTITWDGVPLNRLSSSQLAQKRAVLSQNTQLSFPMKVCELVEMGTYGSMGKCSAQHKEKAILMVLEEVGMEAFSDRDYATLSGGEQKRVMLAKCLLQLYSSDSGIEHKYLLLDEPSAGLDVHQQHNFIQLIKHLVQKYHIGVLTILHDLNLASIFADRITLMKGGCVLGCGRPEQMLCESTLSETFGIRSIVQAHPVYGCPQITSLPL